jgi:2-aminoadipate transaminase
MSLALENPRLLSLAAGFTDTRTLPVAAVRGAVDALAVQPAAPEWLQYGANQGRPRLRELLAARLATQDPGLDPRATAASLFVTNGSQQALYLAMQALCDPGDIVLVDRPSYFVFLELLTGLGVQARSLPVDGAGRLDPAALGAMLGAMRARGELGRLKAVYFVSYYSNPSGRSLEVAEKNALAVTLAAHDVVVPVIEDAAYRELWFAAPHPAPGVLALPAWADFPKLYLSTLTKPFASGLKVGWGVCSDADWLARMLHTKGHHDFGTANFNQAVCEQVLAQGGLDAQLAVARPAYADKMRALHEALTTAGLAGLGWHWQEAEGGLYLWLEAPAGLDTGLDSAFCRTCVEEGVLYVPGELCFGDDAPKNFIRLSYGVLTAPDLAEAARRFVSVAAKM